MSNLQKHQPIANIKNLEIAFDENIDRLTDLLPGDIDFNMMKANFVAAAAANPKILECTRSSIIRACYEACEVGLLVHSSFNEAYIIPYWSSSSNALEAQFQIGYRGMIKLAYNSGLVKMVISRKVHREDEFSYSYGAGNTPGHIHLTEARGNRGPLEGVMCIAQLMTGGEMWEYYDMAALEEIRSRSQSYKTAVKKGYADKHEIWGNEHNTLEMYRKAVWMNMQKWIPKSGHRYDRALEISNRDFIEGAYETEDAEDALYRVIDESLEGEKKQLPAETNGAAKPTPKAKPKSKKPKRRPRRRPQRIRDNELAQVLSDVFLTELYDQTDEMKEFAKLALTKLKRGTDEVLEIVKPADVFNLSDAESHKLMQIARRIQTHLTGPQAEDDRSLEFIRFCIRNEYLLTKYTYVENARKAFIEWELEGKPSQDEDDVAPFLRGE